MIPALHFTAAVLASKLGITAHAVRKRLGAAGPWRAADLPPDYRHELTKKVHSGQFRDIDHLLSDPSAPWQPAIAWPNIAEPFRAKAIRVQRVLRPWLEDRHTLATQMTALEIETRGVESWAREFGKPISTRQWRHLFKRTLDRDRNREEWHRPELYLDDNLRAASQPAVVLKPAPPRVAPLVELQTVLDTFGDKANPSPAEIDLLWTRAVDLFLAQPGDANRPKTKRAIIEWLLAKVPNLAGSFNSARVILDTRCKARLAGKSIGDKRRKHNQPAAEPVADEAMKQAVLLGTYAGENFDGKLAPARRDLADLGLLPASGSRSKSYVPLIERELAAPLARIAATFKRGRRAIKAITPDITRDPDKMFCNDAFTGDDFTMPVIMWWTGEDGRPQIGPGQCLILSDFRSWFVLSFSLQPEANYNSHVVRTLITKGCREHGLPKNFYFERGKIWETSKLLKGDDAKSNEWHEAHSEAEVTYGFETQLGVKFIHAQSPQAKSQIEHLGAILQDMMMGEPGYTGRDQRKDLPDAVKRQIAEVKSGQAHPSKYFYSIEQWRARLRELIEKYNQTEQQGRWLDRISPAAAFVQFQNRSDPPTTFNEHCAYWLTHQVSRRQVNARGMIKFTLTGEEFEYWNEHTVVHLPGRWVLCFFNPELPDSLVVTDLDRRNPVLVPRASQTHPVNPEDPLTRSMMGRQKRCVAALRAQYEVMRSPENRVFRTPVVTPDAQHLNAEIQKQTAALESERREQQTIHARTNRQARELGIAPAALVDDPERAHRSMDLIAQARKRNAQSGAGDGEDDDGSVAVAAPVKTYVLDAPPVLDVAKLRKRVWFAWHRAEQSGADVSRHALTQKHLGHNHSVNDFTAAECARMLAVFTAVARDATKKGGAQ